MTTMAVEDPLIRTLVSKVEDELKRTPEVVRLEAMMTASPLVTHSSNADVADETQLTEETEAIQRSEVEALQETMVNSTFLINFQPKNGIGRFHFTIYIKPKIPDDQEYIEINCKLPKHPLFNDSESLTKEATAVKHSFYRTTSGHRWQSIFQVQHLTPIELNVTLPLGYPQLNPPHFSLCCLWLTTDQITSLCGKLDELWETMKGMPMIFFWTDWLENHSIRFLNIYQVTLTDPLDEINSGKAVDDVVDERVVPDDRGVVEKLKMMIKYNWEKEQHFFTQNLQECTICFGEDLGQNFFRLPYCKHHFCQGCIKNYCELHVKEGTVQNLRCPEPDCEEELPTSIITTILKPDAVKRWEHLLLHKTLDAMKDVEWCPRCNNPCVCDENESLNLAFCLQCSFAFCTSCRNPWHQGTRCICIEEALKNTSLEETNHPSTKKYEELISTYCILKTTKKCPQCKASIEKQDGCNKIMCSQCKTSMCWGCGKKINSYAHFDTSSKCNTFVMPVYKEGQLTKNNLLIKAVLLDKPEKKKDVKKCPTCRQENLKSDNNNHIKCWNCKTDFCFYCKKRLNGPVYLHYNGVNSCPQHSKDSDNVS
ncbi:E3 ubiquitin-protein ligase RNF14-like isoform X2 [Tachypleus tridentatus]|uniref:E3 ubiquitin-protein ligase RNF14-like isoform X2 n=1 Tax=Tachypleus tridentatus TaxID=6853 RepID=UPI003FD49FDA